LVVQVHLPEDVLDENIKEFDVFQKTIDWPENQNDTIQQKMEIMGQAKEWEIKVIFV
jgi:hypothetical protein